MEVGWGHPRRFRDVRGHLAMKYFAAPVESDNILLCERGNYAIVFFAESI